jgi:hypothetical protein
MTDFNDAILNSGISILRIVLSYNVIQFATIIMHTNNIFWFYIIIISSEQEIYCGTKYINLII